MRIAASLLALAILTLPVAAQTKLEVRDLRAHPFTAAVPSGSKLKLHLRSGEFRIVGRDESKIVVQMAGRNAEKAEHLRVRLKSSGNDAELRISGGPRNDLQVTIEVPRSSMLYVRMPAGDLSVQDVAGDKDIELHAGELTIGVGDSTDYSHVDASVIAGDLEAAPFHESHGGLFRSFEKTGTGKYRLHAHVGAGDLTLR